MKAMIYLQDGSVYVGKAFGSHGTAAGELVFNTSMSGYQEILTDPSYAGQIINMTYPLIGNYGFNSVESESDGIHARGFVARDISLVPSNHMSEESIDETFKRLGIVGVYDVDTRSITKKIREHGTMVCVISSEELTITELTQRLAMEQQQQQQQQGLVPSVSTKLPYHVSGTGPRVAVLDFGIKRNILENLRKRHCDLYVFPYDTTAAEILRNKPDGLLLSNGPGDPSDLVEVVREIKDLLQVLPTFGICLGHQLLAQALGGETFKMKYGHRGGNHGVYDKLLDRAYITSQNHGYAVKAESLCGNCVDITHVNLNDNSVEGLQHKLLPVFSVQFHPEGAPGPQDTEYLFDKFIGLLQQTDAKAV